MIRAIAKRLISFALVVMTMLPVIVIPAAAVDVSGLTDTNIGLSYSIDGAAVNGNEGTCTATGTNITMEAVGHEQCSVTSGGYIGAETTLTLTFTNKSQTKATLTFSYQLTSENQGSLLIDGVASATGKYNGVVLEAGGSYSIQLVSPAAKNSRATATISDVLLTLSQDKTTTFVPADTQQGTYTVDGTAISSSTSYVRGSTEAYTLVATPVNGKMFKGWYSNTDNKYLSVKNPATLYSDHDQAITAHFTDSGTLLFETDNQPFDDLNDAGQYAVSHDDKIVTLVNNGTLPSGTYTIPAGITLLIPFDNADTYYLDTPGCVANSYTNPSVYRQLTMAQGANIIVNGAISVSAKHSSARGGMYYGGSPTGAYGHIQMSSDSHITVENGGTLYAWGYITGDGSVEVNSGGRVYENFQITDFRGGTATLKILSSVIFPFSQYYIQNIEVPMTLRSGAEEIVYSSLYAGSESHSTSLPFVGEGGMFELADGTSFIKNYDPATDRISFTVNGDASLNSISLSVAGTGISSETFNLPINNNITLVINSGTTVVNQDVALQPGVRVSVNQGAAVKLSSGKSLYIYDGDQWGNYVYYKDANIKFGSVPYSPTRTYTRTAADLTDVSVDVNGTLEISGSSNKSSGLYTTAGGASIISSNGTGRIYFINGAANSKNTQQFENNSTKVNIPVTSAQLKNADGSYTQTTSAVAGDTYYYLRDKWGIPTFYVVDDEGQEMYFSLSDALNSTRYTATNKSYVEPMRSVTGVGTIDKDLYINLNGFTVSDLTTSHNIYGMDTSTDGLQNEVGQHGYLKNVTLASEGKMTLAFQCDVGANDNSYVTSKDDTGYSFHRVAFGIHQLISYKNQATGETLPAMTVRALFTGNSQAMGILGNGTATFGITGTGIVDTEQNNADVWYIVTEGETSLLTKGETGYTLDRTVDTSDRSQITADAALKIDGLRLDSDFSLPAVSQAFMEKMALARANMEG